MAKAMTAEDWYARAEAYQEAAEHLELEWTGVPLEFQQGRIVARKLTAEAANCRRIAESIPPLTAGKSEP